MCNRVIVLCVSTLVLVSANAVQFPDNFVRCSISDPKLDDCLNKAIHTSFVLCGSKGLPFINLPPLDPMKISKIDFGAGTGAVDLVQHYSDVTVEGFTKKVTVRDAHLDMEKKELTFASFHDKLVQRGRYSINGKILVLPVRGDGDSTIELLGVSLKHHLKFKEETNGKGRFFKVDGYHIDMQIEDARYEFLNLFDGDKALGDNINRVINENAKILFDDVKGGIEKSYGEVMRQLAMGVFDRVPIDQIFLK